MEPMTLEQAHKLGLDVVTVTPLQEAPYTAAMKAVGRTVTAFDHVIPTISGESITLRMLALGPRPNHGNIAKAINERAKTVRQFIAEEN